MKYRRSPKGKRPVPAHNVRLAWLQIKVQKGIANAPLTPFSRACAVSNRPTHGTPQMHKILSLIWCYVNYLWVLAQRFRLDLVQYRRYLWVLAQRFRLDLVQYRRYLWVLAQRFRLDLIQYQRNCGLAVSTSPVPPSPPHSNVVNLVIKNTQPHVRKLGNIYFLFWKGCHFR